MEIENEVLRYEPCLKGKLKFFLLGKAKKATLKAKLDLIKIKKLLSTNNRGQLEPVFLNKYMNLSDTFHSQDKLVQLRSKYDCYICGSVQIWNPAYFKSCQFLDFAGDDKRKLAQFRTASWTAMIKQRNDSGLTIKEWCAANGIQESVYYYRLNRLRKMAWIACETPVPTKD